ncbi:unnamed protein product, partial [Heterosigma akashiwo]
EPDPRFLEGEALNTGLTAPGATIAIGLIYLRSGNADALKALTCPTTPAALARARPDHLLLRCAMRALVEGRDRW